jgi:hypothetical protein
MHRKKFWFIWSRPNTLFIIVAAVMEAVEQPTTTLAAFTPPNVRMTSLFSVLLSFRPPSREFEMVVIDVFTPKWISRIYIFGSIQLEAHETQERRYFASSVSRAVPRAVPDPILSLTHFQMRST